MPDVSQLKEIKFFSNFDDGTLACLTPDLEEQCFKDGKVIFKEDDAGKEMYFIFSGNVEIIKFTSKDGGTSQLLSLLGKGEFFGEMALIDKECRSATAKARGDVIVFKLSCKNFDSFLKTNTHIVISILESLLAITVKRLREMDIGFVTMYETGMLLASQQNSNKLLDGVLSKIMEIIPSSGCGLIALWNEFDKSFEVKSVKGSDQENIIFEKEDAVIQWVVQHKDRLIVSDVSSTSLFDQNTLPDYYGHSFVIQPFIHREELLGFFLISHRSQTIKVTWSQINLLSGIAAQISPVIANAKKLTEEENRRRLRQAKMKR